MKININGVTRDMTAEEEAEMGAMGLNGSVESQIASLKQLLSDTDYKAIKYAEGLISNEEYTPIREQRQAWRDEINRLEVEV